MTNINNLSLRIARQIRSNFFSRCTNSYIRKKVTSRCPLDASAGRSIVEMLGVLAIIGILSVGAIAGYSKAMMKYKLNKHAEQINTVINTVARNIHSFDNIQTTNNSTTPITRYFTKMGEIPVEMQPPYENYLNDIFKTELYIAINKTETGKKNIAIFFMLDRLKTQSNDNLEICKNIVLTAKENRDSITYVEVVGDYKTDNAGVYTVWGDQSCTASRVCLKNISMDEIYTMCTKLIGKQNVNLKIIWDI